MATYSEMTDFEVDAAVAAIIHPGLKITNFAGEAVVWFGNLETRVVRYCKSWADAGPIIEKHLIAIRPEPLYVGGYRWFARNGGGDFGMKAADQNPLRAAMIVFLMMQTKTELERVEGE